MEGKIVVASIDANSDSKSGFGEKRVKVRKPQSAYAKSISSLLRDHGYEVIMIGERHYGKTKPSKDIGLVLVMHGMRGTTNVEETL